jgi:hypothetical protein
MRSGASAASVTSRLGLFVRVSICTSPKSRWLTTHAVVLSKTMSAGPSPTVIRAVTRFVAGETRSTSPLSSATTQTEPAPIQTLYGREAPRPMRLDTRAVEGVILDKVPLESSAQSDP